MSLIDIVSKIIDDHKNEASLSPAWIATEAMIIIDPQKINQKILPLVYEASHLHLRQISRSLCRKLFERGDADQKQHALFPDLQWRYPTAHSADEEEPQYVRLELLTLTDIEYNIDRMSKTATTLTRHVDALRAFRDTHFTNAA